MAGGILVPQPRIEPEPLPCKHRVLTTGPPEKSPHCIIKVKRNPKGSPLDQFLEGGILSASKMLFKFRKIIKEEIKHIKGKIFDF